MNKKSYLKMAMVTLLVFACGKDKDHKDPTPISEPPITSPDSGIPIESAPYIRFSEASLIECQTNDLYATHCRLTNAENKLALTNSVKGEQVITVEIQCSAGKFNNMDFGFRLRRAEGPSPTLIDCRTPETRTYTVQGTGDLELFVENPGVLHVARTSKNLILEVKSIDGQPYARQ